MTDQADGGGDTTNDSMLESEKRGDLQLAGEIRGDPAVRANSEQDSRLIRHSLDEWGRLPLRGSGSRWPRGRPAGRAWCGRRRCLDDHVWYRGSSRCTTRVTSPAVSMSLVLRAVTPVLTRMFPPGVYPYRWGCGRRRPSVAVTDSTATCLPGTFTLDLGKGSHACLQPVHGAGLFRQLRISLPVFSPRNSLSRVPGRRRHRRARSARVIAVHRCVAISPVAQYLPDIARRSRR